MNPSLTPEAGAVSFVHSSALATFFAAEKLSLLVSSYQAQRIMTISPSGEKLSLLMRTLPHPTGMALADGKLAVYSRYQVWFFDPIGQIPAGAADFTRYDWAVTPRASHVTGDIDGHEIAWIGSKMVIASSLFSCLCEVTPYFSFNPLWKPPFITELVPEDRCHLNGIAYDSSGIRFVSSLGRTNSPEGWRASKNTGGVILEYPSGKVVANDLCMPHSPRVFNNRLWFLESGIGALVSCDFSGSNKRVHLAVPGYARGLALYKNFAFIGLSKGREKHHFGDLPVEKTSGALQCGIVVFDLSTERVVGELQFTKGIEELFDIQVLDNTTAPFIVGFEDELIRGVFILP